MLICYQQAADAMCSGAVGGIQAFVRINADVVSRPVCGIQAFVRINADVLSRPVCGIQTFVRIREVPSLQHMGVWLSP